MKRRALLGAALAGLGGCLGTGETPTRSPSSTPPPSPSPTPTPSPSPTPDGPAALADGWPSFQYDAANTGAARDARAPTDPDVGWRTALHAETTADASGVVTAGDAVVLAHESGAVASVRSADGGERWSVDLSGGLAAPPTLAGDLVVVGCRDTACYALDAATGDLVWRNRLDGAVSTPAVVAAHTVYVTTETGSLHALRTVDGAGRWGRALASGALTAPAVGDRVVVGSGDGLVALAPGTGETVWRADIDDVAASPTVTDGAVYAVTRDPARLARVEADGTVAWTRSFDADRAASPAVGPDGPLVTVGDRLVAVSPAGELRWEATVGAGAWRGAPVVVGGTVVAHAARALTGYDPDDGTERWSVSLPAGVSPAPAVHDGVVYCRHGGELLALA